ncbi:MAG: hydantoinase B/oxoprolinase family protein [Planctomycetes bacterium]|nr:hydantoinase B/oxoprolinase family protein [Planctomycetota bacterium]
MNDAVSLALTRDLLASVAEEMAETCVRTAASANVKERRDLSAAVFDGEGRLVAHAAHIPVHLGAMPATVRAVLARLPLGPGDVALANDPYEGGTHLPDVTAVAPLFDAGRRLRFLVAVRAHHADIGGAVPGSMAPQDSVHAEGLRIPPVRLVRRGVRDDDVLRLVLANVRRPQERLADLAAKLAALEHGLSRLRALGARDGLARLSRDAAALVAYAGRIAASSLRGLRDGSARADVALGVGGVDGRPARVRLRLDKRGSRLVADFTGTTGPVPEGLNASAAVTRSAVWYLVRCLCGPDAPSNDGLLRDVAIVVPAGSLLDAPYPAPVAGGNVETSQRVVDALWLAAARLWPERFGAPGAGTMSNWTLGPAPGGPSFPPYYETVPAGAGGGPQGPGADAIQQHMTNTRSTPVEVLEARLPVRVRRHAVRRGSGGAGRCRGGDGLVRELEVLAPAELAWLMTRHDDPPPGVAGGAAGAPGRVSVVRGGRVRRLPPRGRLLVAPGDVLRIETPGGGGWGRPRGETPTPRRPRR